MGDEHEWTGNLLSLYRRADRFLLDHLRISAVLPKDSWIRVDTPEIPPNAMREGVLNALAHRDYAMWYSSTTIGYFDDRVASGWVLIGFTGCPSPVLWQRPTVWDLGGDLNAVSKVVASGAMNTRSTKAKGAPVTLSDGVVLLRPWMSSDATFMAEAATDPSIQRYNSPAPSSVAEALSNIEGIAQRWCSFEVDGDPTGVAFVVIDAASGEPMGMCGIDHWSGAGVAQFGYWLAAVARGRGFATRSVRLMTGWLFERGAARVFLTIDSENAASAAVARRAGFTYEGTMRAHGLWQGQRKDVDVFAVLPDEWPVANDR